MHQPDSCPVDALRACVFLVLQQEKLGPLQNQSNKRSKETLEDDKSDRHALMLFRH